MTILKNPSNPKGVSARHFIFGWIPLWLCTAVLIAGAVLPGDRLGLFATLNDKLIHGTEYFILFGIAANAFRGSKTPAIANRVMFFSFAYSFTMGALTEALQFLVPWRSPEWADLWVDFLGAGVGALLWIAVSRLRGKRTAA